MSSADSKIETVDQKWSEHFNRLEAHLLARTLDKTQEPPFQTVKVALTNIPPVGAVKSADPFVPPGQLANRTQSVDQPLPGHRPLSDLKVD